MSIYDNSFIEYEELELYYITRKLLSNYRDLTESENNILITDLSSYNLREAQEYPNKIPAAIEGAFNSNLKSDFIENSHCRDAIYELFYRNIPALKIGVKISLIKSLFSFSGNQSYQGLNHFKGRDLDFENLISKINDNDCLLLNFFKAYFFLKGCDRFNEIDFDNVKFGKHKGLSLLQISKIDPQYIYWLIANTGRYFSEGAFDINFYQKQLNDLEEESKHNSIININFKSKVLMNYHVQPTLFAEVKPLEVNNTNDFLIYNRTFLQQHKYLTNKLQFYSDLKKATDIRNFYIFYLLNYYKSRVHQDLIEFIQGIEAMEWNNRGNEDMLHRGPSDSIYYNDYLDLDQQSSEFWDDL